MTAGSNVFFLDVRGFEAGFTTDSSPTVAASLAFFVRLTVFALGTTSCKAFGDGEGEPVSSDIGERRFCRGWVGRAAFFLETVRGFLTGGGFMGSDAGSLIMGSNDAVDTMDAVDAEDIFFSGRSIGIGEASEFDIGSGTVVAIVFFDRFFVGSVPVCRAVFEPVCRTVCRPVIALIVPRFVDFPTGGWFMAEPMFEAGEKAARTELYAAVITCPSDWSGDGSPCAAASRFCKVSRLASGPFRRGWHGPLSTAALMRFGL